MLRGWLRIRKKLLRIRFQSEIRRPPKTWFDFSARWTEASYYFYNDLNLQAFALLISLTAHRHRGILILVGTNQISLRSHEYFLVNLVVADTFHSFHSLNAGKIHSKPRISPFLGKTSVAGCILFFYYANAQRNLAYA